MKKIFMFIVMLLGLLVFNNNVKAACGYPVDVGDEMLCAVSDFSSNEAGTAYIESGKLVLNNYNGGQIRIGPLSDLKIELIGDNYITNENGYGIRKQQNITFIGNGTLTIKSKIPVVDVGINNSIDYTLTNYVGTIKISSTNFGTNIEESKPSDKDESTEVKDETNNEINTNQDEVKVEESSNLVVIALMISLCVSMLCLIAVIALLIRNSKLKKVNN